MNVEKNNFNILVQNEHHTDIAQISDFKLSLPNGDPKFIESRSLEEFVAEFAANVNRVKEAACATPN